MQKIDFKKEQSDLYSPKRSWTLVEVPPMRYAAISGQGNPNTSKDYELALGALYALSYTAKFASKRLYERDYVVLPLEGLWTAEDNDVFAAADKDQYQWTMMIRQPDWIDDEVLDEAVATARGKKPDLPWDGLSFVEVDEGLCLQMMHVGSYDDEAPVLAELHGKIIPEMGLKETGLHHEIYLGDPRKVSPEKLKTVLRQPVRRVESV